MILSYVTIYFTLRFTLRYDLLYDTILCFVTILRYYDFTYNVSRIIYFDSRSYWGEEAVFLLAITSLYASSSLFVCAVNFFPSITGPQRLRFYSESDIPFLWSSSN